MNETNTEQSERIPVPSSLEERKQRIRDNSELKTDREPKKKKKKVSGIRAAIWAAAKIERNYIFLFLCA